MCDALTCAAWMLALRWLVHRATGTEVAGAQGDWHMTLPALNYCSRCGCSSCIVHCYILLVL